MLHPSGPERKLCGRENLVCYVELIKLGVYAHGHDDDLVNKSTNHYKIGTKVSPKLGTTKKTTNDAIICNGFTSRKGKKTPQN